MALNYIYSDSTGSTIDITDRCRVNQLSVKDQAEEGAVAISTLVVDDPAGDIDFTGHRRFYIFEDTAPSGDQLIYNGFTFNERITRGPNNVGAGRQWTLDLADVNVFLNRRIMNGADANRPAETDTERIVALLAMTELNTVDDDTFVNLTAAETDMDAADYRGQNVGQYIDDCRQASGKNAYVYYNETLGEYGLWYDFAQSTEYDSGMKLSNILADIDQDTVFEYTDDDRTNWNRDPTRVASGVYLEFAGTGSPVYVQDADTIDDFAAIDWAAPSINVKTLAKATARANRYLADAASEDVKIHVVALMPRAKVNAIKKGQLVEFKASHFPGFENYRVCRVLNRTVNEISEDPYLSFEVEMDLDPMPGLCNDQTPTAEGFYPPLGGLPAYGDPDDGVPEVHYQNAGTSNPTAPQASHADCNWGFPIFDVVDVSLPAGFGDTAWSNAGNSARNLVVGPGEMTVYLAPGPEGVGAFDAYLYVLDGISSTIIDSWIDQPISPTGATEFVVEIPAEVEGVTGTLCNFWVDIEFKGAPAARDVLYGGFSWVPA
jgi:hypothetical protein